MLKATIKLSEILETNERVEYYNFQPVFVEYLKEHSSKKFDVLRYNYRHAILRLPTEDFGGEVTLKTSHVSLVKEGI